MAKLEYTFKSDILFKMLFVKTPGLLKHLVAMILGIKCEDIEQFEITNPEIPPEEIGKKFCRLDITMLVNGKRVDLEIQVVDEHDYPERSLYNWAREYSAALPKGGKYSDLPQVVVISILAYRQFECTEYHSEYRSLEVTRYTPLSDRMVMHYYELPKLPSGMPQSISRDMPQGTSAGDGLLLRLKLFAAETEEELELIRGLGVAEMEQAINVYRGITASEEYRSLERLRDRTMHNEASALANAREEERTKWQTIVAEVVAEKDARLQSQGAELQSKDAEIARLKTLLGLVDAGEQMPKS